MSGIQLIMTTYLLAMLVLGLVLSRKVKSLTDFLVAGRSLGPILCTATLAATHLGGGFILGSGESGYLGGFSGIWYGAATGAGLIILGIFMARRMRELALFTAGDYLAQRYGGKLLRILTALLSLIAMIGILAAQVKAAEGIMGMLGFSPLTGAILATVIFVLYTAASGMWGVAVTDFIQVIIAGLGIAVAAVMGVARLGGPAQVISVLPPEQLNPLSAGGGTILWILLPTVMYTLIGQDFLQRLFSAKSPQIARVSAIAAGLGLVLAAAFPVIAGIAAAQLFPGLDNPRSAIPLLIQSLFTPLVAGIILAAIMAAIMSTADSLLCAGVANLVNDIWKETLGKEKRLLGLSSITTIIMGSLAFLIAMAVPDIISALIFAYLMYTAGVFVPLVGGLFWSKATRQGALSAMLLGSAVTLAGSLGWLPLPIPLETAGAGASLLAFVAVSVFTQPPTVSKTTPA